MLCRTKPSVSTPAVPQQGANGLMHGQQDNDPWFRWRVQLSGIVDKNIRAMIKYSLRARNTKSVLGLVALLFSIKISYLSSFERYYGFIKSVWLSLKVLPSGMGQYQPFYPHYIIWNGTSWCSIQAIFFNYPEL